MAKKSYQQFLTSKMECFLSLRKWGSAFITVCITQWSFAQSLNNNVSHTASFSAQLKTSADFVKSPYTGYTRQHWLEITEKIIAGALAHFNQQTGLPDFVVPKNDSAYEKLRWKAPEEIGKRALERIMIAVVIYAKATGKDLVPGYKGSIAAPFIRAIVRGTDSTDKGYWGEPLPNDQVGSVLAMAVYIEPQRWWEPLTAVQRTNLLAYLKKMAYLKTYDNNHYFFHMVPVALLDKAGVESNREYLTRMYARLFAGTAAMAGF